MKKFLSLLILSFFLVSSFAFAEGEEGSAGGNTPTSEEGLTDAAAAEEVVPEIVLSPRIVAPKAVEVGKKVILDASSSEFPEGEEVRFFWDLGDGNTSQESTEIVHTYTETGEKIVTFTIAVGDKKVLTKETIFVYDRTAILITTNQVYNPTQIDELTKQAEANGVFLKVITAEEESELILEEKLIQKMQEERESIAEADMVLFRTDSALGLQAFTQFWQSLEEEKKFSFENKILIRITDRRMSVAAATLQQAFEAVRPPFFLLTRPEALNPIFQEKDFESLTSILTNRGIEFQIIDEKSGASSFLLLTRIITGFLTQGIPVSTILLLLSFPFIAFFVTFSRQVLGLSTYGVYLPIMLALAFQVLTLKFSLLVLFVILILSFILRVIFSKLDILYVPRAALMLSAIALSLLSVIWFAIRYGSPVAITAAIFPMLIMSTISEKFISAQSEEGLRGAVFGVLETIIVAVAAFGLTNSSVFREFLLSLPEIIILPLFGIFLLGKFTGLRISEYFRFRSLLREGGAEEE